MSKGNIFVVAPNKLVYGGEAMARLPDNRAVFIPFLLPGEEAAVRLVESKRGYARAELLEILKPSPSRITPKCIHFAECGGCHYQHMPYNKQRSAKTQILAEQLNRLAGLVDIPIQPVVAAGAEFNYRNHIQFHLTHAGKLGYLKPHSDEVLAIRECHLPQEALNQVWPKLDFEADPSLERIALRMGSDDDIQLTIQSSQLTPPEMFVEEMPLSVVHLSPGGSLVLAGSQEVWVEINHRPLRVSAGAFFQVNTLTAERLVNDILEALPGLTGLPEHAVLFDLYCGVGLFSVFLAPLFARVVGIESSAVATDDYVFNMDTFEGVELYQAEVEQALPQLKPEPDVVLVDPPRSGISPQAMEALLKLQSPLLVYVSCDPATLSRDARRLSSGGYRLAQITPYDMFPQTYHIESLSFWSLG